MLTPRWKKILADARAMRGRLAMIVIALASSTCALTCFLVAHSILAREVQSNYRSIHPASAQLETDVLDSTAVNNVKRLPLISDAQTSAVIEGRIAVSDTQWMAIRIFVLPDRERPRLNAPRHENGAWPPATGTMLIERSALSLTGKAVGQTVLVEMPGGFRSTVRIVGLVHDPGLAPAWQEQTVYAYVTTSTLEMLGDISPRHFLKVLVANDTEDIATIERTAIQVADWLKAHGHIVADIQVPPPHRHPHQTQMMAILSMLLMFSAMILILGAVLAAVVIYQHLAQKIRELAILKATGASTPQIIGMYLVLIVGIALAAETLGVPLGMLGGRALVHATAELLNLEISSYAAPPLAYSLAITLGLAVPAIIAHVPIILVSRRTVRESLRDYGVTMRAPSTTLERSLTRVGDIHPVLAIGFRNVFRHPMRLLLSLTLLATAGATFMTSMNLRAAWRRELAESIATRRYDAELLLQSPAAQRRVLDLAGTIPGVRRVESWSTVAAIANRRDDVPISRTYPDGGHGSFMISSAAPSSNFLTHHIVEGRWLQQGDREAIVLNSLAKAMLYPLAKAGTTIELSVRQKTKRMRVVGITEEPLTPASGYVLPVTFSDLTNQYDLTNDLRLSVADRTMSDAISTKVAEALEREHFFVKNIVTEKTIANAQAGHVYILIFALVFISTVMATVGCLGMASMLIAGVAERAREFGVMRALGAKSRDVRMIVILEAVLVGLASAVVATTLSLLLSKKVGNVIASISIQSLDLSLSWDAVGIWLALLIAGSIAASVAPSAMASRLTIHDALKQP